MDDSFAMLCAAMRDHGKVPDPKYMPRYEFLKELDHIEKKFEK